MFAPKNFVNISLLPICATVSLTAKKKIYITAETSYSLEVFP
jgi:hypothetical protein